MTTRLFALILIVLSLSACASSPPASSSRSSTPRTRCLADRNDPMRPLIFFLCVESP